MYDLAIIGAGWAGFNASLKAKQLGLKCALVDRSEIGGTCLNLGCIPTKTLIQSAKVFNLIKKSSAFGINTPEPALDFSKIQDRKDKLIQQLRSGMRSRLSGIDFIASPAQIISPQEIKVSSGTLQAKNILIASGSRPYELAQFKFDSQKVLSSDEILSLKKIPGTLLIIGGGVIGCEFASLFSILGSKVTIVEKMPQLLPEEDKEVAKKIETQFKKKGIKVNTNTDDLTFNPADFDTLLVCVGRTPQTQSLGLEKLGIGLDKGRVIVDDYLRTNIKNIYAAGDCASKIMLAHFAGYQGILAVQNLADPANAKPDDLTSVPACIFTEPEIGSIGLNEDKAESKGIDIDIHRFDFLGSGMARIMDETEGFLKIISEKKSGMVIGASIIGPKATELIGIMTLAVRNSLTVKNLRQTLFAHPTLCETITEALR
ncbi:MAG: dihydrolipoyl dehydrogenase [Candidatus Omnitrophica bacterium]|nr:dihydrolipoyl dehydrogenase [Candidatus Omnitrophota bacterium]